MPNVKILQVFEREIDYDTITTHVSTGIDWQVVSVAEETRLRKLLAFANQHKYELGAGNYELVLVKEVELSTVDSHLQKAAELQATYEERVRKQREKEERDRVARAEKRKASELAKKQKLLEKLQKELQDAQHQS